MKKINGKKVFRFLVQECIDWSDTEQKFTNTAQFYKTLICDSSRDGISMCRTRWPNAYYIWPDSNFTFQKNKI